MCIGIDNERIMAHRGLLLKLTNINDFRFRLSGTGPLSLSLQALAHIDVVKASSSVVVSSRRPDRDLNLR